MAQKSFLIFVHLSGRSLEEEVKRLKGDALAQKASYEENVKLLKQTTIDSDKKIKSFANEKAVLTAAVEARDAKLSKMAALQDEVETLKEQVEEGKVASEQLVSTYVFSEYWRDFFFNAVFAHFYSHHMLSLFSATSLSSVKS